MRATPTHLAAPVVACAVLGLVASCGGNGSDAQRSPRSPVSQSSSSSTTSASPTGTAAVVLHVYSALQHEVTKAYRHPKKPPVGVARYAYGRERTDIYDTVLDYRLHDIHVTGAPRISPRVTSLDERHEAAVVRDCFDDSRWIPVDPKGHSVGAPHQSHRYRVTARLQQVDGHWYVVSSTPHRDQGC